MNLKKTLIFFAVLLVVSTHATYRGYLQKQITIPLPYSPALFKFIGSENDFAKSAKVGSFNFCSGHEGEKNSSFASGAIENDAPRRNLLKIPETRGLVTESTILNKEPDKVNPFFDASISQFSMAWGTTPVLVTEKYPNVVYLLENTVSTTIQTMQGSDPLNDALGNVSSGIIGLALGSTGTVENSSSNAYIFAAVKDSSGLYGDGSAGGIAVIKYDKKVEEIITKNAEGKEKKDIKVERFFNVLDATAGLSFGNKAAALDRSALSINGGNFSMSSNVVDMFWNPYVERLYVALQVKNSLECSDDQGSMALLVGRIDTQERLVFDPFIANNLCKGTDKIIGACGKGISTSLHKVRTLYTSSGYPYLVLVGGVGEPHETDRSVYALPLTDKAVDLQGVHNRAEVMESSEHGTIASKNCYSISVPSRTVYGDKVISRTLPNHVASHDELLTKNDKETQVGAGKELPSGITDLIIERDAVYVTCAESGNGQRPGIFHSQAILDVYGKIVSWTPWQRIAGVQDGVETAMVNLEHYFISYLKSGTPEVVCQITQDIPPDTERENAEKEKGDLSDLFDDLFEREKGGILGLYDFPVANPLCGTEGSVSLLVATGYKKIVLVETGNRDSENIFTAFKEGFNANVFSNSNGSITPLTEYNDITKPSVIVVEGGILDEIGALTDAAVVNDGIQAWLVVAGMRGIAILCAVDGSGIPCDSGIAPHFSGIQKSYTFKKLGSWNGIKKLEADQEFLYILTKNSLERITIQRDCVNCSELQKGVVVAHIDQQEGVFFDFGVSGPLGLVATSKGLWVNGAGTDCRIGVHETMQWRQILLHQAKGAVYKLFFVTTTGQKNGFGHTGQLYVSTGSLLENMTRVYRLYIRDVFAEGVTDCSVQLVEGLMYANRFKEPLYTFGNFRDHFATDGAHCFSARSKQTNIQPFMELVSLPFTRSTKVVEPVVFPVSLNNGKKSKNISALVQNSATGNWLVAGDFGLRIHN